MKISVCFEAHEFQCDFITRPSKVRKLVCANHMSFKSKVRKWVPDENFCDFTVRLKNSKLHRQCLDQSSVADAD